MISIIIPTYNEEKYVGTLLSQLTRGLTLPNDAYEVIVSDDMSTDNTVEIARKDATTVLVSKVKHTTIAANRNDGARHADAASTMLVFFDSDVQIADVPAFFAQALSRFENDRTLVALTGKLRVLPESETWMDMIVYGVFNTVHYIKNNILKTGESSGKFQMVRRDAFLRINGYREDLVSREDADLFQRLAKVGRVAYDSKLVVLHSGRRGHALGWPRLLWIWMRDALAFAFFKKPVSKEWKAIR